MGPTIQQDVLQHPVWRKTQSIATGVRPKEVVQSTRSILPDHNGGNLTSDPKEDGRDKLPEHEENPSYYDYVMNSIQGCKPFSLSDIARHVFVNHFYAGEPLILVTSKRLIRLDKSNISTESSVRNPQPQAINYKFVEHLQDSLKMQQLRDARSAPTETSQGQKDNRGIHSEFVEPLQHSLGTMNVGKS